MHLSRWALDQFSGSLKRRDTLLLKDALVVFVCGAQSDVQKPTARDRFMEYAKRHLADIQFFKAEEFLEAEPLSGAKDLLSLEDDLAGYCDCLMVIVESPSSIAELGAFANHRELSRIMLVVNDKRYASTKSFISEGPIAKVNRVSRFKPSINASMDSVLVCAEDIKARFSSMERRRNKRVDLSTSSAFAGAAPKIRMLLLHDVIALFSPIASDEVLAVLRSVYDGSRVSMRQELGMLETLRMVKRSDQYYVTTPKSHRLYFAFHGTDPTALRSAAINHYYKHSRSRLGVLARGSGS
ncbi:MAG: retron St85 family effector protein [Candidatus Eisenbacteria bacterium]|nr:retron St85 family effector protein [Candidatus Eisenbacteria bacterium]